MTTAIESDTEGVRARLHKAEAGSLIAHGVVGDTFPDERLQSLSMILVQIHESDGKLTARHPDHMRRFQYQVGQSIGKRNGQAQ